MTVATTLYIPAQTTPEHRSDAQIERASIEPGIIQGNPTTHSAALAAPLSLRNEALGTGLGGFYDYQSNGSSPGYLYVVPGEWDHLFATYMNSTDGQNATTISNSRRVGYAYSSDGGTSWVSTRDIGQIRLGFPYIQATDAFIPWIAAHGSLVDPTNGPFQSFLFTTTAPDAIESLTIYGAMPETSHSGRTEGVIWPQMVLNSSYTEAVFLGSYNNDAENNDPQAPLQVGAIELESGSTVDGWDVLADSLATITSGGRASIARAPSGKLGAAWFRFALDTNDTQWGIYYAESTDDGRTWGQPTAVILDEITLNGLNINGNPDTLSAGGNLDLAFRGEEPQLAFTGNVNGLLQFASIVFWSPSTGLNLVTMAHQAEGMGAFTLPLEKRQPNMGGIAYPTVAVADDGQHVVVAFQAVEQVLDAGNNVVSTNSPEGFAYYQLWAVGSNDGGTTWGDPFLVQPLAGAGTDSASVEYPAAAEYARMVDGNFELNLSFQARRFPGMYSFVAENVDGNGLNADAGPITETNLYFQQMMIGPENFPTPSAVPVNTTREEVERMLAEGRNRSSLKVYPNVTSSTATIEFTVGMPGPVTLELYNSLGVRVYERQLYATNRGTRTLPIDVSDLPEGAYQLRADFKGYSLSQPVIVVK